MKWVKRSCARRRMQWCDNWVLQLCDIDWLCTICRPNYECLVNSLNRFPYQLTERQAWTFDFCPNKCVPSHLNWFYISWLASDIQNLILQYLRPILIICHCDVGEYNLSSFQQGGLNNDFQWATGKASNNYLKYLVFWVISIKVCAPIWWTNST